MKPEHPKVEEMERDTVYAKGIDPENPTKNVLDLVRAESKYQDAQRDSMKELLLAHISGLKDSVKLSSDGLDMFQSAMRDSETRRIDQLAQNRQEFMNTIRDMLAESVRTTSTLVGNQLVQIQATFDTRVTKLEAYQLTQAGRTSVSDPATSEALAAMASSIKNLGTSRDLQSGHTSGITESDVARARNFGLIFGFVGMAASAIMAMIMVLRIVT